MSLPRFTGECTLYKSTRAYLAATNCGTTTEGRVVPALTKKVCWDQQGHQFGWGSVVYAWTCSICQWFTWARVCPVPPACHWGWVAASDPVQECSGAELVQY
jgi:hypothetical protein